MDLLQCNCTFLRGATRALTQAYDEVLRPCGLRTTQFSILSRTAVLGALPVSELADMLAMDRTTLPRNLQLLERDGLIEIKVGAEDRRERLVHLTSAGRKTLARATPLWESVQRRFESKFGTKESKVLRETMNVIVRSARELSDENAGK
jgi:DNA-binding MarR family transcriptional regulator